MSAKDIRASPTPGLVTLDRGTVVDRRLRFAPTPPGDDLGHPRWRSRAATTGGQALGEQHEAGVGSTPSCHVVIDGPASLVDGHAFDDVAIHVACCHGFGRPG